MTKKFFAILLALVLTLSLSAVAFAVDGGDDQVVTPTVRTFDKNWTTTGDAANTGAPMPTNLAVYVNKSVEYSDVDASNIPDLAITYNGTTGKFEWTDPTFSGVGLYKYTVAELDTGVAGITSYDNGTILIQYLVYFDENGNLKHDGPSVGNGEKKDNFTNSYETHHLTITKDITGNMSVGTTQFPVTVTFSSTKPVDTAISVVDASGTAKSVTWDNNKTSGTLTILVTDEGTYNINNIPNDVTVTSVVESTTDHPLYTATYSVDGATASADTPSNLAMTTDHSVAITNTYDHEVETGITMDSIPYIVLLALAVVGIAAVTMKKRYEA